MTLETFETHYLPADGWWLSPLHSVKQFQGGEAHVEVKDLSVFSARQVAVLRGASGDDLFALAMWNDALRREPMMVDRILFLPYLPGARADRGRPLGAKVYADFINSLDLDLVICLDPHSDVAPALYDRLAIIDVPAIFDHVTPPDDLVGIIAPDAGARRRAEAAGRFFKVPVYYATKHRDFETGELSDTRVPDLPDKGTLMIVDDICDGGRTFTNLVREAGIPRERAALWVTHGVFAHGKGWDSFGALHDAFSWVGCTDSHPGVDRAKDVGLAAPFFNTISASDIMLDYITKEA